MAPLEINSKSIIWDRYKKLIIVAVVVMLFIPFFSFTIVPEWELLLVDEEGVAVSGVRIDNVWKDYSLEFWRGEHSDRGLSCDSNGYIKLPSGEINISIFQHVTAKLRDLAASINPHSSFGPHSYILCRGVQNCFSSYKFGNESPQRVVVR